ncbi:MAG: efflux RND transporter permease subunit [Paracoccaceae bacterium]
MSFSELFIRRPVATILLMVGLFATGIAAYRQLPVAALPDADFPTISVSADLPGASPDTMAASVATPLIKQFETIGGIDTISASSTAGSTNITLQFALSRDIDAAAADVQAAIARTSRSLPANMRSPPSFRKSNPSDGSVIILVLTSQGAALTDLDDVAQNLLAPALSTIDGVAQAQIYGSKTYAVRVAVDPGKLASRDLSLADLANRLSSANDQTPTGSLYNPSQTLSVNARTQLTDADAFRQLIVARPDGRIVRLGDVAEVSDGLQNPYQASWLDGEPSITLAVRRQPDANTVAVVDAILAKLPEMESALPPTMRLTVVNDASASIRAAIADVQGTMALTIGLVILVIFLFLRRLNATMIPGLAVPLSLVPTFGAMYLLGFSVDNISLLGLTLAVGLVVDDAIVMLENITRKAEGGMAPFDAAIEGSREVTGTIISMSLSLIAVFLPILLMGGVVGRVLTEFGIVVSVAILFSALVSLTITPMLAARLPQEAKADERPERWFERQTRHYRDAVGWCLRHRLVILGLFAATFAGSAWLYTNMPRSFFPEEDTGRITISLNARQDISYEAMKTLQERAAAAALANPAVRHVTSYFGGRATFNSGFLILQLEPKEERPPIAATVADLRRDLGAIAGLSAFVTPSQSLRLGGRSSRSQYQVVLQAVDANETRAWSKTLLQAIEADSAIFADPATDLEGGALQADVLLDHDRAAALGISAADLRQTLDAAFGGSVATQIQTTGESYDVILEYDRRQGWDEKTLAGLRVRSAAGVDVPLASFARVVRSSGPVSVNQTGQLTAVTLSFNLPPGVSLGTATARVEALREEIGLPASVNLSFAGAAQIFRQSTDNTGLLIAAAVLTIYVVLGVLYESFAHPLTILSGLPSAALGAFLALRFGGFDFSIIALIGLLMLIGIVKKNAIMMIDVALALMRSDGRAPGAAVQEAAARRFRPIMMTTFCALFAALPIALGAGASAELRQPLGVAVVGGLLVSQILTLFITPVIFVEVERLSRLANRLLFGAGRT